ncbi:MAG TPA: hypothetical protein VEO54_07300 [Thermoanaerobaculia bacterium]|nr:hypothetical protein [Thermoanaerobaculia bacterium]
MSLENDLRNALRRESPPAGFASRVLQRIEHERAPKRNRWWRAVAASVTLTAILGGWAAHTIHERREGERAREQVLLALKIAGEKVRYAQQEVRTIGTNE